MKRAIGVMIWLLLLLAGLMAMERFFRREDGQLKYSAFFGETQPIDVFFLGTSHMMDAVYPMEIWRQSGFSSYNLGNPAETPEATYWTLRLALETAKPRLVVMDVCYLDRVQAEQSNYALSHIFLDEIKLSKLKLQAILSLFPEGERAAYVWPLYYSHGRWEDMLLGREDTTACVPAMRGAELRIGYAEPAAYARTTAIEEQDSAGRQAVRRIIELCRAEGIEVALTAIPYPADEAAQRSMNGAALIAQEYGVPFYNLFDAEGLVDFETDCYDPMSHLNPNGAVKVSRWLGGRLSEDFDLPDRREDPAYRHWHDAYEIYAGMLDSQWKSTPYSVLED